MLGAVGGVLGWLSRRGAIAATAIGAAVLWGAGWTGGIVLGVFFLSGSLLSYGHRMRSTESASGRTGRQVVANGGWAAAGALLAPVAPTAGWALLMGALAAAQADTWGTEIGRRSRRHPRLLIGGRIVPPGTSGGVTWLGSIAGVLGSLLLGVLGLLLGLDAAIAGWSVIGGIAGTLTDSVLGSTVQGRYRCRSCERDVERAAHSCPMPAELSGGSSWIDNDVVNAVATAVGGAVAVIGAVLAV